jgi:hypothetical protein
MMGPIDAASSMADCWLRKRQDKKFNTCLQFFGRKHAAITIPTGRTDLSFASP